MTDAWTLTATEPAAGRLYLANGYLGTALSWSGGILYESEPDPCFIRGVYNDTGPGGIDRLAQVPCWNQIRYNAPTHLRTYRRELDLRHGMLQTRMVLEEARGLVEVEQTVFASRADQHQAVVQMVLRPRFDGDLALLGGLKAAYTEDLMTFDRGADARGICLHTRTHKYGIDIGAALSFQADGWSSEDSVGQNSVSRTFHAAARAGQELRLTQLVRLATSLETDDPLALARRMPSSPEEIRAEHEVAWEGLWQTDIEIEDDADTQQFVRAGLYYLWSSLRENDRWSIAPMGLSSNWYNGHIFWDTELWMYPTLLLTQPALARSCLDYRAHTIGPARRRAAEDGCRGARFPWEGAFTGEEMTPAFAETGGFQLHITPDIALAHWWYFLNTGDLAWLREHGFPLMRECAEYGASRAEYHAERDRYEISDVVCADEYAEHVDNDAFTNAAVRAMLLASLRAAELVGEPAPADWRTVADKIYIPYDDQHRRHLEFDGYDGRVTKQADVELLAFPLEHTTDPEQIERDLQYYATVIDPNGPAMSYSIYSILSAQLGRADAAYDYLKRSYAPNTRPPFQSFSETPTNNEFMFCTGFGGALQALLFGFTGVRLREDHFVLAPLLPSHWKRLRLRNMFLLGARMDLEVTPDRVELVRHLECGALRLAVCRDEQRRRISATWENGDGPDLRLCLSAPGGGSLAELPLEQSQEVALPEAGQDGLCLRVELADGVPVVQVLLRWPLVPAATPAR